jgi:cleavage stimulation factor subunit 2
MSRTDRNDRGGGGDRGDRERRSVFVGNIPYDATEEELIDIFKEVGPVLSFRLVFDRDTGKPKGFGFCEYRDSVTAMSAIRNLNGYEMHGRQLRVGFSETDKGGDDGKPAGRPVNPPGATGSAPGNFQNQPPRTNAPPQMIPGMAAPMPGFGAGGQTTLQGEVNKIVESMSPSQLYEIMTQMKSLITQSPDQAKQLLLDNPQLAYALLQGQIVLGMINPATAKQLLLSVQQMPPIVPGMMPGPPHGMNLPPGMPAGFPGAMPNFPGQMPMGMPPMGGPMPPMPMMNMNPGAVQPHVAIHELPEAQQQLLQQVRMLTPQQIQELPAQTRQQVQELLRMIQ